MAKIRISHSFLLRQATKVERFFENAPVHDAKMEDLDMALVEDYVKRLDYGKSVDAFIRENGFITQVKEHTYLGADGLFKTDPQYPEFCWTELCVNSICHRDYSILGTDIQVKVFDDHITVESPGIFPGLVRPANIRHTHFSRNPKIAAYMHEYKLVKEYGEGVDRMYRELEEAGNPAPEFKQQDFMVLATIRQHKDAVVQGVSEDTSKGTSRGQVRGQVVHLLETLKDDEMSVRELMDKFDFKSRDKFLANYLTPALEAGYVEMTQPDSPKSPTQKYRLSEAGRKVMDGAK